MQVCGREWGKRRKRRRDRGGEKRREGEGGKGEEKWEKSVGGGGRKGGKAKIGIEKGESDLRDEEERRWEKRGK